MRKKETDTKYISTKLFWLCANAREQATCLNVCPQTNQQYIVICYVYCLADEYTCVSLPNRSNGILYLSLCLSLLLFLSLCLSLYFSLSLSQRSKLLISGVLFFQFIRSTREYFICIG